MAVAAEPLEGADGEDIRVSVSIGIAQATAPSDVATLVQAASHAVQRAKYAGKNRVLPHVGTEQPRPA